MYKNLTNVKYKHYLNGFFFGEKFKEFFNFLVIKIIGKTRYQNHP